MSSLPRAKQDEEDAEEVHEGGNGAALAQQPAGENGEAARRRRRRGRRGGRRSRRGREAEPQVASETGAAPEPEPAQPVADVEAASVAEREHQPVPAPIMDSRDEPTAHTGESAPELPLAAAAAFEEPPAQAAAPAGRCADGLGVAGC